MDFVLYCIWMMRPNAIWWKEAFFKKNFRVLWVWKPGICYNCLLALWIAIKRRRRKKNTQRIRCTIVFFSGWEGEDLKTNKSETTQIVLSNMNLDQVCFINLKRTKEPASCQPLFLVGISCKRVFCTLIVPVTLLGSSYF